MTPNIFPRRKLPVRHDPAATCPNIEAFVAATFPPDAHDLAWEIPGVLMGAGDVGCKRPSVLGEGCNGKSVCLALGSGSSVVEHLDEEPTPTGAR